MKYLQRFETLSDYSLAQSSLFDPCVARITETNETKYNKLGRVVVHLTNDSYLYDRQIQIINVGDHFNASAVYSIELDGNDVTETVINNNGMIEFKDNKFVIFKFKDNKIPNNFFKGLDDFFSFTLLIQTHNISDIGYSSFADIDIPFTLSCDNKLKKIDTHAFNNSLIDNIYLNDGVLTIDNGAFSNCTNLRNIHLSNSISYIGDYCFEGCTNLEFISLPNSITSIKDRTFYGCINLTTVIIPESVKSIGKTAFYGCLSLNSIVCNSIQAPGLYNQYAFGNGVDSYVGRYTYSLGINTLHLPKNYVGYDKNEWNDLLDPEKCGFTIKTDYDNYYYNIKDTFTVKATYNIKESGKHKVINDSSNVKSCDYDINEHGEIELNSGVYTIAFELNGNTIGDYAFNSCSSLESIIIGNSVTSIGNNVFSNCTSLESIEIPNSVTSIGDYAFSYCRSLTSITIPNSVTSIGNGAFYYCSSLESIEIPNSVTSISINAFYECKSLTSIEIPNSVTSIGNSAFNECSSLTSITCYSLTSPTIDSYTFYNVGTSGTLKVPTGSNYYNWMSKLNNWTIQYI